jgi:hypothetical protein
MEASARHGPAAQEARELPLGDSIGAVAALPPRTDEITIAHDNVKVYKIQGVVSPKTKGSAPIHSEKMAQHHRTTIASRGFERQDSNRVDFSEMAIGI